MLLTTIPFAGFYESKWAYIVDSWEERECEYKVGTEPKSPLALSAQDYADCLNSAMDYRAAYEAIAQDYAAAYNESLSEHVGFPIGLKFESMTSPREYNFTTDRIFCHIPLESAKRLAAMAGEKLQKRARERFTSRSGFISFYPAQIAEWPGDIEEWDYNQIGTIVESVMPRDDEWEWDIYYPMAETDYSYCEPACDWKKFDNAVRKERIEKLEKLIESDNAAAIELLLKDNDTRELMPDCCMSNDDKSQIAAALSEWQAAHYRCPHTTDLFDKESAS